MTPEESQLPAASTRPASSERRALEGTASPPGAVLAASWRRTSEANEDSLAHLLGEPGGIVSHAELERV